MSLQYSDTSTYKGILQLIEKEVGFQRGRITDSTDNLKEWTADVNVAWDDYLHLALQSSGTWQFDDSNHTKYPIITTNLVSGQRDYNFTTDEQGNLILDIFKVAILPSATATLYQEISPIDAQSESAGADLVANNTATGVPYQYDKTANGIFLDPISSYNATNGMKLYINRETSYFTYTDTTKKPGCPGIHHDYFVLKPAYMYARRNNLPNAERLFRDILRMEEDIKRYFGKRSRDERPIMRPKKISYL